MPHAPPAPSSRTASAREAPREGSALLWVALAVVVGLALRAWEAAEASLWLDELHTLQHASQPDLAAVAHSVRSEFHTPLYFLVVHLFGGWGEGAALRWVTVLTSLLILVPVALLVRELRAPRFTAALACWLLACLPYHVYFGAMLRPHAWIGLLSAACVHVAFTRRGSRALRFVLFALLVLVGLWTHRLMAVTVLAIGAARLFVRAPGMLHLGWLVLAGTLAVAPTLPWLLGFARFVTDARFEYQADVGGYELEPRLVKEVVALPARLAVPFLGALGGSWASLALRAGLVFLLSLAGAALLRVRARRELRLLPESPMLRGVLVFALADFLLVAALSIYSWDRVPLQYFTPMAWVLPLAVAALCAGLAPAPRRALAGVLGASALALGVAQAGGRCPEDMRAAVAGARGLVDEARREGSGAPLVTALLSQPGQFPHLLPYRAYAPDLEVVEPDALPRPGEPGFERPLVALRRAMLWTSPQWQALLEGRAVERELHVDAYLTVYLLLPAQGD